MKIIAMIPARYDSSRFEGKMLADLCGKPVIARTYDAAIATGLFDQVYVVTDHDGIEQAVKANGGQVLRSHKHHETGSDRIAEAVEGIDCDIVVNVRATNPSSPASPWKNSSKSSPARTPNRSTWPRWYRNSNNRN